MTTSETRCECDALSPKTAELGKVLGIHNISCPVFQEQERERWDRILRESRLYRIPGFLR